MKAYILTIQAFVFAMLISLRASAQEPIEAPPVEGPIEAPSDFPGSLARLEAAREAANSSVDDDVLAELAAAIDELSRFTAELSQDDGDGEERRKSLIKARLSLARGYTKTDMSKAEAVIDEILHGYIDPNSPIPIGSFGTSMNRLFKARQAAMETKSKGTVRITCFVDCEVSIDTYPVKPGEYEPYLGKHVVRYRSIDGSVPSSVVPVELGEPGHEVEVGTSPEKEAAKKKIAEAAQAAEAEKAAQAAEAEKAAQAEKTAQAAEAADTEQAEQTTADAAKTENDKRNDKRKTPLGVSITGAVIGTGLIVGGGVFLSFDGLCPNGSSPDSCPKRWEASIAAPVSIAVGAALWVTLFAIEMSDRPRRSSDRVDRSRRARVTLGLDGLHF